MSNLHQVETAFYFYFNRLNFIYKTFKYYTIICRLMCNDN